MYGDAVFVLEPWCWALLGTTLALNATWRARAAIGVLTLALLGAVSAIGLLPRVMLIVMLAGVGAAALAVRAWDRRSRAAAALAAIAIIILAMPAVSGAAKRTARSLGGVPDGNVVDVLADANPGVPWCGSVLSLERAGEQPPKSLVARRATLSLLPRAWPAGSCASARLGAVAGGDVASSAIVWQRRWEIDVDALRALAADNCRVRAWLQFGRAPFVDGGRIRDLRFENPVGQNFTVMSLDGGSGCPKHLTDWQPPRADVLNAPDRR